MIDDEEGGAVVSGQETEGCVCVCVCVQTRYLAAGLDLLQ